MLLLQHGATVSAQNVFKFTPMHNAAFFAYVAFSLVSYSFSLLLIIFSHLKHSESVDCIVALLDAGANIESVDQNGWTVLHIAASKGNIAIVEVLLKRGAAINATTNANQTPLLMAACNGHLPVVRLLLANSTNRLSATNLAPLKSSDPRNFRRPLCPLKKDADTKTRVHSTHESCLIYAVQNGHLQIAKELITHDPYVRTSTKEEIRAQI